MSILKSSFSLLMRTTCTGYSTIRHSIGFLTGRLDQTQLAISSQSSDLQRRQYHFTHHIAENISYLTKNAGLKPKVDPKTMKLITPIERPLCIMLIWLGSTQKNVSKYTEIYFEQGYDLLTMCVPMYQAFFPEQGVLQACRNLLHFMEANDQFNPYLLHSFSIGTFMWAELLEIVLEDPDRFLPVVNRFKAQIWDSMVDVAHFKIGVAKGIFPNNKFLQNIVFQYLTFHQKIFYNTSTRYYDRATIRSHKNLCKSPALLLCSKGDLVGPPKVSFSYGNAWKELGTPVEFKCWEKAPHVQIYRHAPKEYLTTIGSFLDKHDLLLNKPAFEHRIAMLDHKSIK